MIVDPEKLDRSTRNGLINGLIGPRPIAWVSTLGEDGSRNLAPFSFFNAFSFDPPVVAVGPGSRAGVNKDTLRNAKRSSELVINMVDRGLAERANGCSGEWGPEVDEWEVVGVTPAPSEVVAPMRVAESPASLECRVREVVELGTRERASNGLIIADVVRIHVRDDAIDGYTPDPDALDLVGRMGGDWWTTTRDRFELARPARNDPDFVAAELKRLERGD